jgi:cleavage stimulation factor subunit 3
MDTLRKVYQRAVSVPHNATLEIWREYDKFEMSVNKVSVSHVTFCLVHTRY